jgi:hypothetical protein
MLVETCTCGHPSAQHFKRAGDPSAVPYYCLAMVTHPKTGRRRSCACRCFELAMPAPCPFCGDRSGEPHGCEAGPR